MPTSEKEQRVKELTEAIARSKSIVLANFTGMNVDLVTKMRRRLRDAHVEFIVEKNTLAKRALAGSGVVERSPAIVGVAVDVRASIKQPHHPAQRALSGRLM